MGLMKKLDAFEEAILTSYEKGAFQSASPCRADLAKFKAASSATFLKTRSTWHADKRHPG